MYRFYSNFNISFQIQLSVTAIFIWLFKSCDTILLVSHANPGILYFASLTLLSCYLLMVFSEDARRTSPPNAAFITMVTMCKNYYHIKRIPFSTEFESIYKSKQFGICKVFSVTISYCMSNWKILTNYVVFLAKFQTWFFQKMAQIRWQTVF